jgi:hypothetical protein
VPGWVTTHAPPSRQGDAGAAVRRSRRRWRDGCHPTGDAEAQASSPRTTADSEVWSACPRTPWPHGSSHPPGSVPGEQPSAALTVSSAPGCQARVGCHRVRSSSSAVARRMTSQNTHSVEGPCSCACIQRRCCGRPPAGGPSDRFASYARVQLGQRQPSRSGDQPGPAALRSSGAKLRRQRQHVRAGRRDSGGMAHDSVGIAPSYEHMFPSRELHRPAGAPSRPYEDSRPGARSRVNGRVGRGSRRRSRP